MPRIRTVKPEFWRNKQLAKLPEFTRLLAIALLNYSDDEGFFDYDEDLIRGECFPYEHDSSRVTVGLRELSSIGYVCVRHLDDKSVGMICKFKDHQVVNKPKKSKFRALFEGADVGGNPNPTNTVLVPEDSGSDTAPVHGGKERKGAWSRDQGEGKEEPLSLSSHGKDESFRKAWRSWIGKQSASKPNGLDSWTEMSQLKELERFSTEEAIAVVEYSTSRTNCVNLITNGDHRKTTTSKKSSFAELGL
jgi:hypothetical protein